MSSGEQTGSTPQVYPNMVTQNKNSATARNQIKTHHSNSKPNHYTDSTILAPCGVSEHSLQTFVDSTVNITKGKPVPLQAWSGPEGSRKLRFPDFMTTAQDGGKVVSLMHLPPLHQEMLLILVSVRG